MDQWGYDEMAGARVKDARRRKSLGMVLDFLAEKPAASFSAAAGPAKRQAMRRLFTSPKARLDGKQRIEIEDLLAGHRQQTLQRVQTQQAGELILVAQDTTHFDFNGLKQTTGLGYANAKGEHCLFGHSALMLTKDGVPLGVPSLEIWAREEADYGKRDARRKTEAKDKESHRWARTLLAVEAQLPPEQPVLFIQDREADIFAFLRAPTRLTTFLLVRASQPRNVEVRAQEEHAAPQKTNLFEAVQTAPVVGTRQVRLPRAALSRERLCDLTLQAVDLDILPPVHGKDPTAKPVSVRVLRAVELTPPVGEKAVEWVLITTMPEADAGQMVAYYAKRWTIERLHYAIKSGGCHAERLQMETAASLKLALALYYVTAWRLLYLTYLARVEPDTPAAAVLDAVEIVVLEALTRKALRTLAEGVQAIACLGGHEPYKNGPPPGVKRLWLGLRRLEDMVAGWQLATQGLPLPDPQDMIHG